MKIIDYAIRALAVVYLLCLVRQLAWVVPAPAAAWTLAIIVTVVLARGLAPRRRALGIAIESTPDFAVWVALPLAAMFLWKLPFPDLAVDLWNYHHLNAERALRGWPPGPHGDFAAFLNPLPDMIPACFRYVLGYRLGTIASFLALLWTGTALERLLRPIVENRRARHLAVLWLCLAGGLLLQLNGYMVDMLALPLLIEATWLVLHAPPSRTATLFAGALCGAAIALKLTNVPYAGAVLLVHLYRRGPVATAGFVAALAAPLLPYHLPLYLRTGNPLYPLYNWLFASGGFPYVQERDPSFGPRGFVEMLQWPVISWLDPHRSWETPDRSGRMLLGTILALATLRRPRALAAIFLVCLTGWIVSTGNLRYAFYPELIAGVLILTAVTRLRGAIPRALGFGVLAAQALCGLWCHGVWERELHSHQDRPSLWLEQAAWLGRDHELARFLPDFEKHAFDDVEGWIRASPYTGGPQALLRPGLPAINLYVLPDVTRLRAVDRARFYTLCPVVSLDLCLGMLEGNGLGAVDMRRVIIPNFSVHDESAYVLARVERRPAPSHAEFSAGEVGEAALRAGLAVEGITTRLRKGETRIVNVTLRNLSREKWPVKSAHAVQLGSRWRSVEGELLADGPRALLATDLAASASTEIPIRIVAPARPGAYLLEMNIVLEGRRWSDDGVRYAVKID